ncbi:hypothetical protein ACFSC4_18135 [Deinococcus malanensis]|uniref:hypothetical protein n=1 Tax=Deinococcus malanensis TaxID=1706855 RepID=UPI003639E61F
MYRQGLVWLWKRHGGDEGSGSAYDLLLAYGYSPAAAWEELARLAGVPLNAWTPDAPRHTATARDPLANVRSALERCAPFADNEVWRATSLVSSIQEGDSAACELMTRGLYGWDGLEAGKLRRSVSRSDGKRLAHPGALVFTVRGPDGRPWGLKVRNAGSADRLKDLGLDRYVYAVWGHGSPAWCSPGYGSGEAVLIVEGELNGAAASRALMLAGLQLDVQGLAGAGGAPFLDGLTGKVVYLYADPDEAGTACLERLARIARGAGAAAVRILAPLPDGDFCDIAGTEGLARLGRVLKDLLAHSTIHHTVSPSGESVVPVTPHHHFPRGGVVVEAGLSKYRAKLDKKLGGSR